MIIVFHHQGKHVAEVQDTVKSTNTVVDSSLSVSQYVKDLAKAHPDSFIIWCDHILKPFLNTEELSSIFHHKRIMASFSTGEPYFSSAIGYVEDSPFIKVNRDNTYPTWQMHQDVGGVHANVINSFEHSNAHVSLSYGFSSMAKLMMDKGLLCYSEPRLLQEEPPRTHTGTSSISDLYRFVRGHYRGRWSSLLLLNRWVYEKKVDLIPFFRNAFRTQKRSQVALEEVSSRQEEMRADITLDVVIPTMGRAKYLKKVFEDLSAQTLLPKRVIVVEQNPDPQGTSELSFLNDSWPFEVIHDFRANTGACAARNWAFGHVSADWVFLADDDIRLGKDVLQGAIRQMMAYNTSCATLSCRLEGEDELHSEVIQWRTFGSGCSILKADLLKKVKFDTAYEHGFGEDADFGLQLRNLGVDVLYLPKSKLLHLKAPVGGFRVKYEHPWVLKGEVPKPSPTVMLFRRTHHTREQLRGYKTTLFWKFYKVQSTKLPSAYLKKMKKQWELSEKWASQLQTGHEV